MPYRSRTNSKRSDRAPRANFESPKRRSIGGDQVEGRQAVRELVRARVRKVDHIWIEDTVIKKGIVAEITDLAVAQRIPLLTVSRKRFETVSRSEGSQGILAKATPVRDLALEELVEESETPFLVVIDGITDPHNLGAVLRSAELAGVTGVILPQNRTTLVTPTVTKSAAGAIEYLKFALVSGIPSALRELSLIGVTTVGLEVKGTRSIFDLDAVSVDGPVALVLGAEDKGLSRLTRERCDYLVNIPQVGRLDSLNVSAAAAIALFEIQRVRGKKSNL